MATAAATPDFSAYADWADRLAAFRGTEWESAALHSIAADAERAGELDYARAAQSAGDGCEVSLAELDQLIAEDTAAELAITPLPADYFWRDSQHAINAGLAA